MTQSPILLRFVESDAIECPIFMGNLGLSFQNWFQQQSFSSVAILCDTHTRRHCLPVFIEKVGLDATLPIIEIPPGESAKHLDTTALVWLQCLEAGLDRHSLLINLGGGVIGDLGGFCAATWKRGFRFVQAPTTLLSMTDAAIGGKTGIDFQGIKNCIGVFQSPNAVFVDVDFLKTLPDREYRSGMAEVLKHALIGDLELWASVQKNTTTLTLEQLQRSIAVKVRIVQEDPLERGLRMLLNYGHTIGHGIESYFLNTNHPLTHGEAIAIGMACESYLAKAPNLTEIVQVLRSYFPPQAIPESAFAEIWRTMQHDKKNRAEQVSIITPDPVQSFSKINTVINADDLALSLHWWNKQL